MSILYEQPMLPLLPNVSDGNPIDIRDIGLYQYSSRTVMYNQDVLHFSIPDIIITCIDRRLEHEV